MGKQRRDVPVTATQRRGNPAVAHRVETIVSEGLLRNLPPPQPANVGLERSQVLLRELASEGRHPNDINSVSPRAPADAGLQSDGPLKADGVLKALRAQTRASDSVDASVLP
jgi:hypothetical protein